MEINTVERDDIGVILTNKKNTSIRMDTEIDSNLNAAKIHANIEINESKNFDEFENSMSLVVENFETKINEDNSKFVRNCTFVTGQEKLKKNEEMDDSLAVKIEEINYYNRTEARKEIHAREENQANEMHFIITKINETMQENQIFELDSTALLKKQNTSRENLLKSRSIIEDTKVNEISVEEGLENKKITETKNEDSTKNCKNTKTIETRTQDENLQISKSNETMNFSKIKNISQSMSEKSIVNPEVSMKITSLAILASAYENSDSEYDEIEAVYDKTIDKRDEQDMEIQITKEYRRNKPTLETSDEESESDDSSQDNSSSSSETESDEMSGKSLNHEKKNEGNRYKASQEKEMKGEFDDLPPIEELKISVPEVLCDPLGEVGWMVEQMVVVRPKPGKPTLNLDTILFVERGRRVLGRIFDVFGQVSEPHYCVRFNSTEHIRESDIKVGMIVYFCPNTEYTSVVFLQDLLKMKATDEIGDDENPEFSDDEEERAYYAAFKQKQRNDKTNTCEVPQKRQRTDVQDPSWKSNHPWNSGKKQKTRKIGKTQKTNDRSSNIQENVPNRTNLWQYQSSYPNISWPINESYSMNTWQSGYLQNSYGFPEHYEDPCRSGNSRFSRQSQAFRSATDPYMQNQDFSRQSAPTGYPIVNYSWQGQTTPRQPDISWTLPPPPPPPPPGI